MSELVVRRIPFEVDRAVVLIDEIDLHLHPSWQRVILSSLEDVFPAVQFIATTHSPQVVQSMRTNNMIALAMGESQVSVGKPNTEGLPRGHRGGPACG